MNKMQYRKRSSSSSKMYNLFAHCTPASLEKSIMGSARFSCCYLWSQQARPGFKALVFGLWLQNECNRLPGTETKPSGILNVSPGFESHMHEHQTLNVSGSFTRVSSMCHKMSIHLTCRQSVFQRRQALTRSANPKLIF